MGRHLLPDSFGERGIALAMIDYRFCGATGMFSWAMREG
jgi:hypothetical protein